jgi:hypothetical protein
MARVFCPAENFTIVIPVQAESAFQQPHGGSSSAFDPSDFKSLGSRLRGNGDNFLAGHPR